MRFLATRQSTAVSMCSWKKVPFAAILAPAPGLFLLILFKYFNYFFILSSKPPTSIFQIHFRSQHSSTGDRIFNCFDFKVLQLENCRMSEFKDGSFPEYVLEKNQRWGSYFLGFISFFSFLHFSYYERIILTPSLPSPQSPSLFCFLSHLPLHCCVIGALQRIFHYLKVPKLVP
jgi:hypothetical protein